MRFKSFLLSNAATFAIASLLGLFLGTILGYVICSRFNRVEVNPGETQRVTETVVLERIKDQAFLVTRSVITDQSASIDIDQGSAWSNFWWGHEINTQAQMQVDVGVDIAKLTEDDIDVDEANSEIFILLPDSEVHNVSLASDITVTTQSGILKKLLDSDQNEDFNLALEALSSEAQKSVEQRKDIMDDAYASSVAVLQAILKDTGYTVVVPE